MLGKIISHFKILEKIGHGEWMSARTVWVALASVSVLFTACSEVPPPVIREIVSDPMYWWLAQFLFVVVLIAVAVTYGQKFEANYLRKRRNKALRPIASEIGFKFHPDPDASENDPPPLPFFFKFGLNHWGAAAISEGDLTGKVDGNYVALFDQELERDTGEFSRTIRQTVVGFQLETEIAKFHLKPKKASDKAVVSLQKSLLTRWTVVDPLSSYGEQDIQFDSHPEFSKNYRLRGTEENAVRALFHPGVLDFFESHRGWSVEAGKEEITEDIRKEFEAFGGTIPQGDKLANWLVVYRLKRRIKPAKIRRFLDGATDIFRVFEKQG